MPAPTPTIYDGSGTPPPERHTLHAGRLTMVYEDAMLRYIRLGSHEIVRGIYAAVRDRNWGTVPGILRDVTLDVYDDHFSIAFVSEHRQAEIHYLWRGSITGTPDNVVTFTFDGEALSTFERNRIGFCVLHPLDVVDTACTVEHVDGTHEHGAFPPLISPHQPFFAIRAVAHDVTDGVRAEVRMEGDTFEMEDQRNWTDASFKTYCTPLTLPFPVAVQPGERVMQRVTLTVTGTVAEVDVTEPPLSIEIYPQAVARPLTHFGLTLAADDLPLPAPVIERVRTLAPAHLRVDIPADESLDERLRSALDAAHTLGTRLLIALHFGDHLDTALDHAAAVLAQLAPLTDHDLLVLHDGEKVTTETTFRRVQAHIGAAFRRVIGGTDAYFAELNRARPIYGEDVPFVYSVNPQVHAFDNASLVETFPALQATVNSAERLVGHQRLILVSPVTFKPRWNPNATAPTAPPIPPGERPQQADPRQTSLFGAGWTLGVLAALIGGGCETATLFAALTGWLGIMDTAGTVYPLFHVLADVSAFSRLPAPDVVRLPARVSHPLLFSALALWTPTARYILVANHTANRLTVTVSAVDGTLHMKSLDEWSAAHAMRDPEAWRALPGTPVSAAHGSLILELLPYAVVRLHHTL